MNEQQRRDVPDHSVSETDWNAIVAPAKGKSSCQPRMEVDNFARVIGAFIVIFGAAAIFWMLFRTVETVRSSKTNYQIEKKTEQVPEDKSATWSGRI